MSKISDLQKQVEQLNKDWDESTKVGVVLRDRLRTAEHDVAEARKEAKEAREQFADLKQRLFNAERENERMRGYIQRVQEDDVVREDLITVGDPAGEQQMVPKRKPTEFVRPADYSRPAREADELRRFPTYGEERRKPRHWITY